MLLFESVVFHIQAMCGGQPLCWKELEEEDLPGAAGADRAPTIQESLSCPACPQRCPRVKDGVGGQRQGSVAS